MSEPANTAAEKSSSQKPIPPWLSSGLTGMVLGAGAMVVIMNQVGYRLETPAGFSRKETRDSSGESNPASKAAGAMQAMMVMGGGLMAETGPGGGGRSKRNLTALVGKLALFTKGLHFELNTEQSAQIGELLAALDQADKMTTDEAQTHLDALEAILTDEQKATLGAIDLPRGRQGGGGSGGGGGGMGMGVVPMPGMAGMGGGGGTGGGGGGGGSDDANPFRRETDQQRLRDLLNSLQPAGAQSPAKSERQTVQ